MSVQTLALVGAVGGAGATRLSVEFAAMLARDGRSVVVLDAAYATQGLVGYAPGRVAPDLTALCLTERPLADGEVAFPLPAAVPGRVVLVPALAPFERVARAKTPAAARRLEERVLEAAERFDHVLVDVPPVAANQAVAAVHAADRRALVAPATPRGRDARPEMAARLADVGTDADLTVANRVASGPAATDADVVIPESEARGPGDVPTCLGDGPFAAAVRTGVARAFETDLSVEVERGGLRERYRRRFA